MAEHEAGECGGARVQMAMSMRPRWWLVGIIVAAVVLRVVGALCLGDVVAELPGTSDQLSYHVLALRVLNGHGFSFGVDWWPGTRAGEPTAHWSYLYTGYLVSVYQLFGPHSLAARLVQAVLAGVLHPCLAWRIGRRVFGEPVGLVSAALTACYAYFMYYSGALMTETFCILAILWVLDLATGRLSAARDWKPWLLLGVALGIAILLRQVVLVFVPFLLAWLWWRRSAVCSLRSTIVGLAVAVAVLVATIVPWTVHNYRVFGRFVLLNTNAGYAFFWANHPIYGTNFVSILPRGGPSYQELIPPELRHLDEAALDQALLREGLRFVVEDPLRYLLLSLSRVKDYFKFWPSSDSSLISNVSRVGSFGVCLPFMLYGLWLSVAESRHSGTHSGQAGVTLLWLFVAVYTVIHLLSWALIRYRLPVDAVLLLFAGSAVVHLWRLLMKQRNRRTAMVPEVCSRPT